MLRLDEGRELTMIVVGLLFRWFVVERKAGAVRFSAT